MASKETADGKKLTWKVAQTVLNENDIKRMACCYFHCDAKNIDWASAAEDFGSASANSMRVMMGTSLKKVKAATASAENGNIAASTIGGAPAATPSSRTKAGRKDKRVSEEGENGFELPKTKKSRNGPKITVEEPLSDMQEPKLERDGDVKAEPED